MPNGPPIHRRAAFQNDCIEKVPPFGNNDKIDKEPLIETFFNIITQSNYIPPHHYCSIDNIQAVNMFTLAYAYNY
ncbi:hypothetical protein SB6408_03275 [Klebsiella spallanzanii]|uniref:Uncharacterized protein n=1 Tax=Klebsiella spallanzanii TaxID=2587528 RepID=A0A564HZI5_9ENTR|nr:hypothetical protein SB6408_03275 [Klebsiella spallanzanii]